MAFLEEDLESCKKVELEKDPHLLELINYPFQEMSYHYY
jgi:hypothetical protein